MGMPACRLVQQTSLLVTASLPLVSLPLPIKCFVHSQLFGHSYLNHIKLVASGWAVCLSARLTPGEPGEQPLPEVLWCQPLEASGDERGSKKNLLQANDRLSMRKSVDGRQLNHGPYCDYDCFHSCL